MMTNFHPLTCVFVQAEYNVKESQSSLKKKEMGRGWSFCGATWLQSVAIPPPQIPIFPQQLKTSSVCTNDLFCFSLTSSVCIIVLGKCCAKYVHCAKGCWEKRSGFDYDSVGHQPSHTSMPGASHNAVCHVTLCLFPSCE